MRIINPDNYFWQGNKVRLRPMIPQDVQLWLDESTDSDGVRVLQWGVELPKSEDSGKEFADKYCNFKSVDERIMFSIETLSEELVGGINLHSKDQKNGTFSFGIRIYTPYRRKGYAEDALRILLRYGFHELRYQKCNSGCVDINEASARLHREVGFIEEGRQRRSVYMNGQFYDHLLFGLTREEFDENEKEYMNNGQ